MRRTETVKTRVLFFISAVSQLSDIRADGWEITWVDVGGASRFRRWRSRPPVSLYHQQRRRHPPSSKKKVCPVHWLFSPVTMGTPHLFQCLFVPSRCCRPHICACWSSQRCRCCCSSLRLVGATTAAASRRAVTSTVSARRTPGQSQTGVSRGGWPCCQVKQSEKGSFWWDHGPGGIFLPLEGDVRRF